MSHYPYGYGYQGQQPPQPQQPQQQYPYPPSYGAYPAPGYGAQPPPQQQPSPATAEYHAATQSAYDYNANNIPGLGAPLTAPQFPVPYGGQWDQPGYGASATPAAHPAYNASPYAPTPPAPPSQANSQARVPVPQETQPDPRLRPDSPRPESKTQLKEDHFKEQARQPTKEVDSQDEGEISDGEFDDLYEDVYDQPVVQPKTKTVSPVSSEDHTASSTDQAVNFYDTEVDEVSASNDHSGAATNKIHGGELSKDQDPLRPERDRSGSYSPYLSPREIEQEDPKPRAKGNHPQGNNNHAIPVSSAGNSPGAQSQVHISSSHGKENSVAMRQTDSAANASQCSRSLPEAQNEAKKAILRLLPHGVKYQTYLDEGFDEKVIKDLFTQLNLAPVSADPASSGKPPEVQEHKTQDQDAKPAQTSQADAMAKKQEERKDKIARLLAEKKAKAAAEATTQPKTLSAPASTGASTPSTTTASKATTQAQKNLLLQQKMEALRKAREARTQQAGQQLNHAPTLTNAKNYNSQESSPMPPRPGHSTTAETSPVLNPPANVGAPSRTLPTPPDHPRQAASQPSSGFQSPVLPGLSNKQINQRKRPVAADFVDYPAKTVKRPFLPSRQASSLVISVSDDEDEDDEDVDMEVDSTTEDSPAPTQQTFNLPRRGPSVRDYPPLTNSGPPRHVASPAPGTPGGKTATVDLKAMEKAIADYKRKIQEAEARAKVKPSTGSSTPQSPSAGGRTPTEQATRPVAQPVALNGDLDDKNGPSNQLLQEAEAAKTAKPQTFSPPIVQSKAERRVRKPSAPSPRLSTKLQDKIAELKRMEEEKRRLQAEIDAELAQQRRMEEEGMEDDADDLGSDSAEDQISETVPADKHASSSGESGRDEAEETAHDGPLHSMPMDLESSCEKSDSGGGSSASASLTPADAVVDDMGFNVSINHEPDIPGDASQLTPRQPAEVLAAIATSSLTEEHAVAVADSNRPDVYGPPDEAGNDLGVTYSPPFSPAPAENIDNKDASSSGSQETASPPAMPTHISSATIPNDDPTIEARAEFFVQPSARTADMLREDAHESIPPPKTSFTDYESPLRYYHAFRFHPKYSESVAGGLKSLTYSNRIDPKREICPDELDGQDCPRGSACQFQHFSHMVAPDDKIILELGSSDDLAGDLKKTFNNGLRELVASFQKSKIRDFRTIAQGIVEFRRRFLGDSSRVLHLEGVSI